MFEALMFAGARLPFGLRLAFHLHSAREKDVVFQMNVPVQVGFNSDEVSL
jgi:hypothetical protein